MGKSLFRRILESQRLGGSPSAGEEVELRVDQALFHDRQGILILQALEALGVERCAVDPCVCYVDHRPPRPGYLSPDLPRLLAAGSRRFGIHFSRAGNGISHHVHAERFAAPGRALLGADSHAGTAGGLGMLALSGTPLELALALAGRPFVFRVPRVRHVRLLGSLPAWLGAMDLSLELLRRIGMRGAFEWVIEYGGPGLASLSAPARLAVAHLGSALGAAASLFPSDERTRAFLRAQGRDADWKSLVAEPEAAYDDELELDLGALQPLAAGPDRPDRVVPLRELGELPLRQVCIGSYAGSSAWDLTRAAALLAGRKVHPDVSLTVVPGSRQVLALLDANGSLEILRRSGARVLESFCGPSIGASEAPPAGTVSLRSFSRDCVSAGNGARVYLASPETCAASAAAGRLYEAPRQAEGIPLPEEPPSFPVDDSWIARPGPATTVEPPPPLGLRPLRPQAPLAGTLRGMVLIALGDDVTCDHILPNGARIDELRSDLPALARHLFSPVEPGFAERAALVGGGFVVAGRAYGLGSGRVDAALAMVQLGIRAVLARSFARAHRQTLVGQAVLPLVLVNDRDRQANHAGDELEIPGLPEALEVARPLVVRNLTRGFQFAASHGLNDRELEIVKAGGLLARVGAAA